MLIVGVASPRGFHVGRHGSIWLPTDSFDLNGNNIHRLENVLTLDIGIHSLFDELKLWFEPTVSNSLFDVPSSLD
jgi:hypothetical protein